jgi:putative acetyltransferase
MSSESGQSGIIIRRVSREGTELQAVRELFLEYAGTLGFSLCFQGFDQELANLPGDYAPPTGCLLLAADATRIAGCVAVRRLDAVRCEIKRLYVRTAFRGSGLGRRLAEDAIACARRMGYRSMLLDTLPQMRPAVALYHSLGFVPCASYYDNSAIGSTCMMLAL